MTDTTHFYVEEEEQDSQVLEQYSFQCPYCNGIRTDDSASKHCDESCGDYVSEQYEFPRHEELNFNR